MDAVEDAIAYLEKAKHLRPKHSLPYFLNSMIYFVEGDFESSAANMEVWFDEEPDPEEYLPQYVREFGSYCH